MCTQWYTLNSWNFIFLEVKFCAHRRTANKTEKIWNKCAFRLKRNPQIYHNKIIKIFQHLIINALMGKVLFFLFYFLGAKFFFFLPSINFSNLQVGWLNEQVSFIHLWIHPYGVPDFKDLMVDQTVLELKGLWEGQIINKHIYNYNKFLNRDWKAWVRRDLLLSVGSWFLSRWTRLLEVGLVAAISSQMAPICHFSNIHRTSLIFPYQHLSSEDWLQLCLPSLPSFWVLITPVSSLCSPALGMLVASCNFHLCDALVSPFAWFSVL